MSELTYRKFLEQVPASAEFVYVLTSDYTATLIKIGRTKKQPHERCKELNSQTGLANDHWQVSYAVATLDSHSLEARIHRHFADKACGGEVFKARFDIAVRVFSEQLGALAVYNAKDQEAEVRAQAEIQAQRLEAERRRLKAERISIKESARRSEEERLAAIESARQAQVRWMVEQERALNAPVSVGNVLTSVLGNVAGLPLAWIEPIKSAQAYKKGGAPWKKGFWKGMDTAEVAAIRKFAAEHPEEMKREREKLEREEREYQAWQRKR